MDMDKFLDDLSTILNIFYNRLKNDTLSNRDKGNSIKDFGDVSESLMGYDNNFLKEIADCLNNIVSKVIEQPEDLKEIVGSNIETIQILSHNFLVEEQRKKLMHNIFQADFQEMGMHETKVDSMQELVNLDIKDWGMVTEETKSILEVQNYVVDDNDIVKRKEDSIENKKNVFEHNRDTKDLILKLSPMGKKAFVNLTKQLKENGAHYNQNKKEWTVNSDNPNLNFFKKYLQNQDVKLLEDFNDENVMQFKNNTDEVIKNSDGQVEKEAKLLREESYQGTAYMKNSCEIQKPTVVYGNTPEDIITTLRGWNQGRTDSMKLESCYIRKLNTENNKYENMAKYDIKTGINITPIYLSLPHVERGEFLKLRDQLKTNGAKWNPVKKRFFITQQDDLNKFSQYLPLPGTDAGQSENIPKPENELNYDVEVGQEYYDNRINLSVEGYAPFNVYGNDYNVHFPSMNSEEIKETIDKFVLPNLVEDSNRQKLPQEIQFDGKSYDPLQFKVIQLALKQEFTNEQMQLILRPELTSDRMNEVRFAIMDKLTSDQIMQWASPEHELWQMDFCRIGMQHGLTYDELKNIIKADNYSSDQWGERRNQLQIMVRVKKHEMRQQEAIKPSDGKNSIIDKLNANKAKIEAQTGSNSLMHEDVTCIR